LVLAPDRPQLLAVAVVREGDQDARAGPGELPVELANRVREVEDDLRHVRPALQVAAALELEEVALGADDDAQLEAFQQTGQGADPTPARVLLPRSCRV